MDYHTLGIVSPLPKNQVTNDFRPATVTSIVIKCFLVTQLSFQFALLQRLIELHIWSVNTSITNEPVLLTDFSLAFRNTQRFRLFSILGVATASLIFIYRCHIQIVLVYSNKTFGLTVPIFSEESGFKCHSN